MMSCFEVVAISFKNMGRVSLEAFMIILDVMSFTAMSHLAIFGPLLTAPCTSLPLHLQQYKLNLLSHAWGL